MRRLFEENVIGGMRLANRMVMPPMVTDLANRDGTVSPELINYYARRGRGGVALIVVEATSIDSKHLLSAKQLRIDSDKYRPGLTALVQAIKEGGAKVAVQLHHPGRSEPGNLVVEQPVAPSAIRLPLPEFVQPKELTRDEIRAMVERYAAAALRAKETGFDAVELHGAHSYLICQFLSPFSNQRTDEYGGSLPNRTRFAIEVIKAVKARTGASFPVTLRLSAQEFVPGGLTIEDTCAIARIVEEAGCDAISVSAGNRLTNQWSGQPVLMRQGVLAPFAASIRQGVKIPVMVAGRINDPAVAEDILSGGKADLVCLGRALLADPDLPLKTLEGRDGEIRRCIACMTCGYQRPRGGIACLINPECGHEGQEEERAPVSRRVLVLGGGPGELEAARVARLKGHQVTLWMEGQRPGGRWTYLIRSYASQQLRELKELGVQVEPGRAFSASDIARFQPDAIVSSPGLKPVSLTMPGVSQPNVFTAEAVLDQGQAVGPRVAILGAGNAGCEVAYFLSNRGIKIAMVESSGQFGAGLEPRTARVAREQLSQRGVAIRLGCQPLSLSGQQLTFRNQDGAPETLEVDHVILALGYEPDYRRLEELAQQGVSCQVVKSCAQPLSAYEVAREGAALARRL